MRPRGIRVRNQWWMLGADRRREVTKRICHAERGVARASHRSAPRCARRPVRHPSSGSRRTTAASLAAGRLRQAIQHRRRNQRGLERPLLGKSGGRLLFVLFLVLSREVLFQQFSSPTQPFQCLGVVLGRAAITLHPVQLRSHFAASLLHNFRIDPLLAPGCRADLRCLAAAPELSEAPRFFVLELRELSSGLLAAELRLVDRATGVSVGRIASVVDKAGVAGWASAAAARLIKSSAASAPPRSAFQAAPLRLPAPWATRPEPPAPAPGRVTSSAPAPTRDAPLKSRTATPESEWSTPAALPPPSPPPSAPPPSSLPGSSDEK